MQDAKTKTLNRFDTRVKFACALVYLLVRLWMARFFVIGNGQKFTLTKNAMLAKEFSRRSATPGNFFFDRIQTDMKWNVSRIIIASGGSPVQTVTIRTGGSRAQFATASVTQTIIASGGSPVQAVTIRTGGSRAQFATASATQTNIASGGSPVQAVPIRTGGSRAQLTTTVTDKTTNVTNTCMPASKAMQCKLAIQGSVRITRRSQHRQQTRRTVLERKQARRRAHNTASAVA